MAFNSSTTNLGQLLDRSKGRTRRPRVALDPRSGWYWRACYRCVSVSHGPFKRCWTRCCLLRLAARPGLARPALLVFAQQQRRQCGHTPSE